MQASYHYLDHVIDADLAFPELTLVDTSARTLEDASPGKPERITVAAGSPGLTYAEAIHDWVDDGELSMTCDRNGQWYRLVLPGQVTTHIDTGKMSILYDAEPGVDLASLRHFIIDQAIPRLLGHRGSIVLHGGCIGNGSEAIVFLGDAGVGKSTLCASFLQDGWTLMSDDCLSIACGQAPSVQGAYAGLRLYPETLGELGMGDYSTRSMAAYSDKKRVGIPATSHPARLPLKLVVSLAEADTVTCEPLSGASAVLALISGTFNLAPGDGDLAARNVEQYAGLIEGGLSIITCHFPRDITRLPEVKASILGVLESAK